MTICGDLDETKLHLAFSILVPVAALSGGQRPGYFRQPARPQGPVSYSSVNQLNLLLSQLEQASQAAQVDLAKLRVEKWKTDSGSKRQAQGNVESIQRNLQSRLPEIIAELKASPESLTSTFKLYRNLDALYDVFESVAESAGAFGSKDEFQSLENDVSAFEKGRRSVADRMETLAGAKESEVTRLRAALQNAQASMPVAAAQENCGGRRPPRRRNLPRRSLPQRPSAPSHRRQSERQHRGPRRSSAPDPESVAASLVTLRSSVRSPRRTPKVSRTFLLRHAKI